MSPPSTESTILSARNQREAGGSDITPQLIEHYHMTSFLLILVCGATGTAAIPGLLCQPRVIVKMIVEKQIECRLAGETEVL
jgi:hypothetical protein